MPPTQETPSQRRARYEATRRRQAVRALQLGEQVCRYASAQLCNGATPEQARDAAVDAAGELAVLAAELRRLTRLRPSERRALAISLAALGMPTTEIADRLGVTDRTVRYYRTARPRR